MDSTMEFMRQQHLDELLSSSTMLENQYHAASDIFGIDTQGQKEMQLSVTREAISICLDGLVPSIHNDPNSVLKNMVVVDGPPGRVELNYYLVKHDRYDVVSLSDRHCAEEGFPISVWLVREKALDAWFDAQEQLPTETESMDSAQEEPYVVWI